MLKLEGISGMGLFKDLQALLLLALVAGAGWAQASLPPVECGTNAGSNSGCSVVNYQRMWADRQPCHFQRVVYPKTERQLVAAVAQAVLNNTNIRLVSKGAHAFPKLVCPAGNSGILISTRDYNRIIHVNVSARTVTVDAGVLLKDMVKALADKGLALPHSPNWSDLSISGLIATGAHGSSLWGKGGAVHEYVTSIRIVVPASAAGGYATVRTFSAASPRELAAARVHLGVLGAISQVTLRVQPQFKRSVTYDLRSDADLESRLFRVAKEQEFGEVTWWPAQRQARYRLDNRVPITTKGDGVLESFTPLLAKDVIALRAAELLTERTRNSSAQCAQVAASLQFLSASGFGLANNRSNPLSFQGYPVVGLSHLMMTSSSCSDGPKDTGNPTNPVNQVCAWDLGPKGFFAYDNAVSLPLSTVGAFIQDVRRLLKKRPLALCGLEIYSGILMRFVKGNSGAYLGKSEDSVDMDFIFRRGSDAHTPRLNEDVLDEVEQMVVLKYGGKPHWGKGRPIAFTGVAPKYPHLKDFLKVKRELDPHGFFSNEWTDAVLGIRGKVFQLKPFCALEGLCICQKDIHCAPNAGYFCRPGLVYKQARVCRFQPQM